MRHGFKTHAEKLSIEARVTLGLRASSPLDPWKYAAHLGVVVLEMAELSLPERSRRHLLEVDSDAWSGMTIREGDVTAIIVNPAHPTGRRNNTCMHELAHFILKHVPARVDVSETGMLLLSEYADEAEAEADWLAGALLIPRDALISHRRNGDSAEKIAKHFGTSEQLCEWRLRMTGVDTQLRRAKAR